jgi:phage baseplate assembly protein V
MELGDFRRLLAPVQRKVQLMLARAVLTLIDDAHGLQLVQAVVNKGDLWDGLQRMQNYGLTSVPLPGAEAVVAAIGGSRSNGVALAVDDRRYRPQSLAAGAVCLYDASGTTIMLENDGTIVVTTATKLRLVTPLLQVTGDIIDHCDSQPHTMAEMRSIFDTHTHAHGSPPDQAM